MSLIEWGSEFPISGNIQRLLESIVHSYKPLKQMIRSLTVMVFLFEDSSVLVLPVSYLQSNQNIHALADFIKTKEDNAPDGVYYMKNDSKVVDLVSASDSTSAFAVFKEDFTYDIITMEKDGVVQIRRNERLGLNGGQPKRIVIQNNVIGVVCEIEEKLSIFCAKFELNGVINGWALQCHVNEICDIFIHPPCLYILKGDGIHGCALDDKGLRKFSRSLVEVLPGKLIAVSSFTGLYVLNTETLEVFRIVGKKKTLMCQLKTEEKDIEKVLVIGNRIFAVSSKAITSFELVSGEVVAILEVPLTEHWITSLDRSYGAVFIGAKCFTVSKTEIAPLINLYGNRDELLKQMKSVSQRVGTVAAPIMIVANRSPFLAATLLEDEIANECEKPPTPGSLQEKVHPILIKLNYLLLRKPK